MSGHESSRRRGFVGVRGWDPRLRVPPGDRFSRRPVRSRQPRLRPHRGRSPVTRRRPFSERLPLLRRSRSSTARWGWTAPSPSDTSTTSPERSTATRRLVLQPLLGARLGGRPSARHVRARGLGITVWVLVALGLAIATARCVVAGSLAGQRRHARRPVDPDLLEWTAPAAPVRSLLARHRLGRWLGIVATS